MAENKRPTEQELLTLEEGETFRYRHFIIEKYDIDPRYYMYCHEDYDGPEDNRCGIFKTVPECIDWIDEMYQENWV